MYNRVNNPIPQSNLFATKTLVDIQALIETFPAKQKADAYLIMQLTLNSCHQIVEDEILSKEIFV